MIGREMNNGLFEIFNETFLYLSLLIFFLSVWLFVRLKNSRNLFSRMSLVGASLLSIVASVMPAVALLVTISFIPSFIYHMFKPLMLAPFVVGAAGFVGTWSLLVVLQELAGFFRRNNQPPKWGVTIFAMLVFIMMGFKLNNGLVDYSLIVNSQQIVQYASTGTDQNQLKRIYTSVALSHDSKLFDEVLSALSLNHNVSPELLRVVYARTVNSDLDVIQQNYILLNLSKNPHTSSDLLKKLMVSVSQSDTTMKADSGLTAVSRNPNFSPETILQFSSYPDCEIRRAIISYPNISEQVLSQMIANDPDVGIKHDAKRRLDFLHGISHLDADKKTPVKPQKISTTLVQRARDTINAEELTVIYSQSENNENANSILENLASNCYTSADMLQHIYEKSVTLKGYAKTAIFVALSVNPKTPTDILQKLANEKDLVILRGLVSNPNISNDIIVRFTPFPDCKIRKEIVCIPGISRSVLTKLRQDNDESVALEATERLREENAYLNICREMKKLNPSCQKYYGTTVTPELRSYPNTSEADELVINSSLRV
jgi:hypothetical protein